MKRLVPLALLAALLPMACRTPESRSTPGQPLSPPVAQRIPHTTEIHGQKWVDDYFWLREKTNAAVLAYLEAENAYTEAVLKPTERLQDRLYREMLSHIKETDVSAPYLKDGYYYYSRTLAGRQYPIHCRKRGRLQAREEVVLDLNQMAKGLKFLRLGAYKVSDNGLYVAYSTDVTGFREYTLQVKDLRTGRLMPLRAERTVAVEWAGDNQTVFYTVQDHAKRSYRLYRQRVDQAGAGQLVYEERDERFNVDVGRSRSRTYLFLSAASLTSSEVRFLRADQPEGAWEMVEPRQADHEYSVDHHTDSFFILSNATGRNFALFKGPIARPGRAHWRELVAHRPDVMLRGLEVFRDFYVLHEFEQALAQLRVTDLASGESHRIRFEEPAYAAYPETNAEFDTSRFRYGYVSMVTPKSVYDYDVRGRTSTLIKATEVPGGFDRRNYRTERLHAAAVDGVQVPITLVYRADLKRDGKAPLLLYGYGAYGYPHWPAFDANDLTLLDRGVVYAVAHIRGGGELGKPWHDDGRMMRKMNTFTDFIAAAEHLIAQRFTSPERLAIEGGSAGGLLMGAVTNLRPDLFRAVISHVPFVDVINTMLDESLPLTVAEFEEWGNPKIRAEFDYLMRYSPYDNLRRGAYPAILVKTSLNDSQVMYWEPAKYVARLRTHKTDPRVLLLKTNMAAGHGGSSGRYDYLREVALDQAFVLTQLGVP